MLLLPLLLFYVFLCYCVAAAAAAAAAVRHRVPDANKMFYGLNLILLIVFLCLHSSTKYFGCTPWQCCRIYALDLPTSSVVTGMRGAKAGASPPLGPPCMICCHVSAWFFIV